MTYRKSRKHDEMRRGNTHFSALAWPRVLPNGGRRLLLASVSHTLHVRRSASALSPCSIEFPLDFMNKRDAMHEAMAHGATARTVRTTHSAPTKAAKGST